MMADGKFYWLKLKRDFFKRHDIRIIESMPNGKDYILFYLKLLCEAVDHEGNLRFSDRIPYSESMLATITNTDVDVVRSAIKIFDELGMMEIMDDGTYFMHEVERMIGSAVNNDNANRQRRFRERKKQALLDCDTSVTKNNESKRKSKSKSNKNNIRDIVKEFSGDDAELADTLMAFVHMRATIKKPLTDRAMKMILNKLRKMSDDRETWIKSLDQSILHSWQDVYEIKEDKAKEHKEDILDDIL